VSPSESFMPELSCVMSQTSAVFSSALRQAARTARELFGPEEGRGGRDSPDLGRGAGTEL